MSDPISALRARFIARAADDLAALQKADADRGGVIHRLAGTAGVFGFGDLSALAAVVDDQLHAGQAVDADDWTRLMAALEAVAAMRP